MHTGHDSALPKMCCRVYAWRQLRYPDTYGGVQQGAKECFHYSLFECIWNPPRIGWVQLNSAMLQWGCMCGIQRGSFQGLGIDLLGRGFRGVFQGGG